MKTLVSQEILASIGFKKKNFFKITKILDEENVIYIFVYNFANVVMKPESIKNEIFFSEKGMTYSHIFKINSICCD